MAIRVAENLLFIGIVVASIIAAVIPIVVSLGLNTITPPSSPGDVAEVILAVLSKNWLVIVYLLVLVFAVSGVLVAIHSFVQAGCAKIFVDAERKTAALDQPRRSDFNAFDGDTWMRGGVAGFWAVFWIFNIAWTVASMVILLPATLALVAIVMVKGTPVAAVAVGCVAAVVTLFLVFTVSVVTSIWTQKAIVLALAYRLHAMDALAQAWDDFRADTGRHVAVALILLVILFVGSVVLSSMTAFVPPIRHSAGFSLAMMPLQLASSFLNGIFSAAIGSWMLACFAALSTGPRK